MQWTELPDGFRGDSVATVGGVVIVGGMDPDRRQAVLDGTLVDDQVVLGGPWSVPRSPHIGEDWERDDWAGAPARVSAGHLAGVPTAIVDMAEDQGGSWGYFVHPLDSTTWEYIPNVTQESDIGVAKLRISDQGLFTFQGPGYEGLTRFWHLRRAADLAPYPSWEKDAAAWSFWRPEEVALPDGVQLDETLDASPDGRWLALGVTRPDRVEPSPEVLVFTVAPGEPPSLHRREPSAGASRIVALTSRQLVVKERVGTGSHLWWTPLDGSAPRQELSFHDLEYADLAADGDHAALASADRLVLVDLDGGSVVRDVPIDADQPVRELRFVEPARVVVLTERRIGVLGVPRGADR